MKELFDYIDAHSQEYIALLQKFCRQPSISATGVGLREMAELIQEEWKSMGVSCDVFDTPRAPILYGELEGKNASRRLAFYNHYDVMPVDPVEEWVSPPFEAEIRDGKLWARGATDNKGSLLSRLCAVKAIQGFYGQLPLNLSFLYEGEEEVGSPHLHEFVQAHPERLQADGFVWEGGSKQLDDADGTPGPLQICLGVKGLLYVELRCRTANADLHSQNAPIIQNPAWRLVQALSTMKDADDRIIIDGFYDSVCPSTPHELDCLDTVRFEETQEKERLGLRGYINNLTGRELKEKLYYQPTCNIAGFRSGYLGEGSKTVLPCSAVVKMDFRLVPNQTPEEIFSKLRAHLDRRGFTDIEAVMLSGEMPFRADPQTPLVPVAVECAREVYGVQPEVYVSAAGTTAMYDFCHKAGLNAIMFGAGNIASNIHSPNENIILKDYISAIKMAAAVMMAFGK